MVTPPIQDMKPSSVEIHTTVSAELGHSVKSQWHWVGGKRTLLTVGGGDRGILEGMYFDCMDLMIFLYILLQVVYAYTSCC